MNRKILALPLALSATLLLGACGDKDDDLDDVEVNDPLLEDDGENDIGVPEENTDENTNQDDESTENSTENSTP